MQFVPGILALETGEQFFGQWLAGTPSCLGEVVFNTGMTGYEEILTDPSYAGQIVVLTYPLVGNTGINRQDAQTARPVLNGFVLADLCASPSHYQSRLCLADYLLEQKVPTLSGADTRSLVQLIRRHGTLRAWMGPAEQQQQIPRRPDDFPRLAPELVQRVSTDRPYSLGEAGPHVVLYDLGSKRGIAGQLVRAGCRVTVVPWDTPAATVESLQPDGLVYSNGPGDPQDLARLIPDVRRLTAHYPTLGICLGHQLLALAYGAQTGRLPFGHHGSNHPVVETESGRVFISSQNHNFTVLDAGLPPDMTVSHRHVNDGSIEGLVFRHANIRSIQFHPEASPGPYDMLGTFRQFVAGLREEGGKLIAAAT